MLISVSGKRLAVLAALTILPASAGLAQTTFVDQAGRTVTLAAPPNRLAALPSASAIVYFALDGTAEHMIGGPETLPNTLRGGLYDETIPELTELDTTLQRQGFVPNVEAILAAQPDLVYQVVHKEGVFAQLEAVGLKLVGWSCCTQEQRRGYITMSGAISGKPERAEMLLKMQDDSNAALRAHFSAVEPADYVSMLEVDKIGDQIQVVANSSQDYALSGVTNLAADDTGEWWRTIDAEQFLVWNPAVIIIPAWAVDLTPQAFYDDPLLGSVAAIQNRRVYKVPKFNRSPDAPEVHLTAQWLARITHPEDFAGQPAFRDTIKATFKEIYGKDLTEDQVDRILELEANGISADYAEIIG